MHGSTAHRAVPERVGPIGGRLCRRSWVFLWPTEQLKAQRQQRSAIAVGKEAEVADAYEPGRQQMEQEAAQELIDGQSHERLLVAVRRVAPAEGYVAISESDQPGVRDSDAMGVGAEIAQHMFRAAKGSLGVNNPVVAEQQTQPGSEGAWLRKVHEAHVGRIPGDRN